MASTSASSIQKSFKYDVFLSFRGEDTRKNFVDHLYHALQQRSIYTYRDDEEIKKGKRINDELIRSIEDSKFYIIVFSKNYASSSWCLDELVKIMECQKTNEHIAFPVFFDVEPSEVRKQSGAVGEAFAKHKELDIAGKWRDALKEAADLAGWELKNTFDGHEAQFIKKIIEEISLELRPINYGIDEKLVGMEERVKDVVSSLEVDTDHDVRLIGIKGMGGAGKTTLARAVFDHISYRFEGSSFVENVREVSKGLLGGLKSLQKQVLSDVLNEKDITVNGVYEGKNMMRDRMRVKKVLLVLDDVDLMEQLEALAGDPNWFKLGSRVIITTRDKQVLEAHRVNLILDVNLLLHKEAICLFSRYAFGREIPIPGYEDLSEQVVSYAAGLPLTIRVLGSFLCGKDELEWTDALDRLKMIPLKETLEKLELSYNSLEEDYKEIFLDVACILKGWEKEEAIVALESCGFHARSGLKVLEQKSLIKLSIFGHLGMHDHIEEMGKNIVRRLHPRQPYRHSRLWIEEEVNDILVEDKGTKATRCLKLRSDVDPIILMKGLKNMKELRFLEVTRKGKVGINTDIEYDEYIQYLPKSLRYLCWDAFPFTSLRKIFEATNLVGLRISSHRNIHQLWEEGDKKVLKKLRFLHIGGCSLQTLDVGLFPNLEWLKIDGCSDPGLHMRIKSSKIKSLTILNSVVRILDLVQAQNLNNLTVEDTYLNELHMPDKLKNLVLNNCENLKTLNLTRTPNLQTLHLENSENLVEIHMPAESLELKTLNIQYYKLKNLNLTRTPNLETLTVIHRNDVAKFHISRTTILETLVSEECEDLVDIRMPVECPELKRLNLFLCKLTTLNLTHAPNLEELFLKECEDLVELHVESLELKSIYLQLGKLKTLNIKRTPNLQNVVLKKCENLEELHMPIESLKLEHISLQCCKLKTFNLTRTPNLERLEVEECEDLVELCMPLESLKLKHISLRCCKLKTLNLTWTPNVEMLEVEECEDLVELCMPLESLKLKHISLRCCKLKTLNLTRALSLETLKVEVCGGLVELHMPVENLKLEHLSLQCCKLKTLNLRRALSLETLKVEECGDLVELHMPVESLKLKSVSLQYCFMLKTIDLGLISNLERLDVKDCYNLVEIHAPVGCLKQLVHMKLTSCIRFKPFLVNPWFPDFGTSAELHLIAWSLDICPLHPNSNLPKFQFEL